MLQDLFVIDTQVVGHFEVNDCVNDTWLYSQQHAIPYLTALSQAIEQVLLSNKPVLVVHSTCATSLASVPQAVKHFSDLKLLWLDAHPDFNTPERKDQGI